MVKPRVTVVIPAYNASYEKLERTLLSVITQTYSGMEVIVVDDGSDVTDGFTKVKLALTKELAERPSYSVKFIRHDRNLGVSAARNTGIRVAAGEFIALLDCGDWWAADKIARQVRCFDRAASDCGLIYCGAKIVDVSGPNCVELYSLRPKSRGHGLYAQYLISNMVTGSCSAAMIRKSCFDDAGYFYADGDIPEDLDMWARIAKQYAVDYVDDCLSYLEKDMGSRDRNPGKTAQSYWRYFDMRKDELMSLGLWNKAMAKYYSVIGKKYILRRQLTVGVGFFIKSLRFGSAGSALVRLALAILEGYFDSYALKRFAHYLADMRVGKREQEEAGG